MVKINILTFVVIIFITFSCSKKRTLQDFDVLYRQRINNSSKVIYYYQYFGDYAFSDWKYGKAILDSTAAIEIDSKNELPFCLTDFDLDSNKIEGFEFVEIEDISNTIEKKEIGGIDYFIKKYRYKEGSSVNFFYTYRSIKETRDSLFFENPTSDGFGIELPNGIGFKKRSIIAKTDSLGYVEELKFVLYSNYQLNAIISKVKKKEWFAFDNKIDMPPLSLIYSYNMSFKPDSLGRKQRISDYGIYKRIK